MSLGKRSAFRKGWWILTVAIAVGLGGAFAATQSMEPQYDATCRLFVAVNSDAVPSETYQAGLLAEDRVCRLFADDKGESRRIGRNTSARPQYVGVRARGTDPGLGGIEVGSD